MIRAADEGPRPPTAPGFSDAVAFAFGDLAAGRHGLVRIEVADGRTASALAALEPGPVFARGGIEVEPGWDAIDVGGVAATVEAPLARWRLGVRDADAELEFHALGAPAPAGADGYVQLCRVTGRMGGVALDCLGQRSHVWGVTDWEAIALTRAVAAWVPDGPALALGAVRPRRAAGHGDEARWGVLLAPGEPAPIADPRISATYAGDHPLRAGLELWVAYDDELPLRASGEPVATTTVALDGLRLDAAVMRWSVDGRAGAGRYDVLRRV